MEACVEGGAHHVDISGEPQYLEKMQLKYHQVLLRSLEEQSLGCSFRKLWRTEYMLLELAALIQSLPT